MPRLISELRDALDRVVLPRARPGAAQVCQYVVATISEASSSSATSARREICLFIVVRSPGWRRAAAPRAAEVRDDRRAAVRDERQRDPGQRDDPQDAADDDERLQREAERQAGGEQLREAVVGLQRDLHAARDEEHEDEQQRRGADEAELLGERRVDEVACSRTGSARCAVGRRERALAEPGAAEAAVRDRVERLDELVALAVLAQREPAGRRAVDLVRRPRLQPDRDALVDVRDLLVGAEPPARNSPSPTITNDRRAVAT